MQRGSKQGESASGGLAEFFDSIQSRYGWTDDYILSLPYARFIEIAEISGKEIQKEKRERMEEVLLVGYQFYLTQPRINEKKKQKISWKKWKESFGLKDEALNEEERQAEIRRAYESAEAVKKAFRRRP